VNGPKRDRVGQRIGSLEVLADHKRTSRGQVVWRRIDHATGREHYYRTEQIVRLDREHNDDGASA
jgi:hypothetical protein